MDRRGPMRRYSHFFYSARLRYYSDSQPAARCWLVRARGDKIPAPPKNNRYYNYAWQRRIVFDVAGDSQRPVYQRFAGASI